MALHDLAFQTLARTAILAELTNQSDSTPVLAHPKPDQALPFIHVGETEMADNPAGHWLTFVVHVWSKTEGPHGVKTLQSYIHTALHAKNFEASGVCYTACRQEFQTCNIDIDEEIWHGVQRFTVLISE